MNPKLKKEYPVNEIDYAARVLPVQYDEIVSDEEFEAADAWVMEKYGEALRKLGK